MTTQNVLYSYTIEDDKHRKASLPIYGTFDDSSATLSGLLAYASVLGLKVDAVTDGQIVSMGITVYPVIPGTFKDAPVEDSDVEESGKFAFQLSSVLSRSYSVAVPAIAQTEVTAGDIDAVNTGASKDFSDAMVNHATTVIPTNNLWLSQLEALVSAEQTFRKRGKRRK